jgi:uncharacterized protein with NRDE domain
MCLLLLALESHPTFRLVVAANRDEFYDRPAAAAAFWPENPSILAGRDLEAGGTWLGVTLDGRFAALTNFREPGKHKPDAPSRGGLVEAFLQKKTSAAEYVEALSRGKHSYNGFSLLAWDGFQLAYCSNRDGSGPRVLDPGLYGLSNGTLDEPWPKVTLAKRLLTTALADTDRGLQERLFALLGDRTEVPDDALPRTGLPVAWERALSPIFVTAGRHGTRCSTVLLLDAEGRAEFEERSFSSDGCLSGRVTLRFILARA